MREKSFSYFELRDACSGTGCPVCRVLALKVNHYLDSLFYENVNDAPTRQKLREALGFCRTHALTALSIGDAFGVAIIYEDLLRIVTGALAGGQLPAPAKECPACTQRRHFERSSLGTLREWRNDPELQSAFKASDGLCLYHLRRLSEDKNEDGLPSWVRAMTVEKVKERRSRLSEFLRKQDVRAKNERLSEREESACEDAIDFLVGMSD